MYSTCSVHRIENEDVVAAVLEAQSGAWKLVRCLPEWTSRGLADAPGGALCVRASEEDDTHGFFVARFEHCAFGQDETGPQEGSTSGSMHTPDSIGETPYQKSGGASKKREGASKKSGAVASGVMAVVQVHTLANTQMALQGVEASKKRKALGAAALLVAATPTLSTAAVKKRNPEQLARRMAKKQRQR